MLYKTALLYPQILKLKVFENEYFFLIILQTDIYTITYIYMIKAQQCRIKS